MAPLAAALFYRSYILCFYVSFWICHITNLLLCNADSIFDYSGVVVFTDRHRMLTYYDRVSLPIASHGWMV